MSADMVKQDLSNARSRSEADAVFKSAYAAGFTLQELGDFVGHTREYIRQRVARPVDPSLMREYPPHERVIRKQREAAARASAQKRILGLRLTSPALSVPVATLNELSELHSIVTEVRGWTPLDAPSRAAIKPFGDLLFRVVTDYGIPQTHLERLMGLKGSTFSMWFKRHGHLKNSPSQRTYRGVTTEGPRARGPKLTPGGACKRGHELTEANIGKQATGLYCKTCRSDAARRKYHEKRTA